MSNQECSDALELQSNRTEVNGFSVIIGLEAQLPLKLMKSEEVELNVQYSFPET